MVEIDKRHILIITFWKTWEKIWNIQFFVFMIVLSGVYITYATRVKYMILSSQDLTITLISAKSRTKENMSQENGRSTIRPSNVSPQFSKYTTTTGKTAEMQYNLMPSTTRPNSASIIYNSSTDQVELYTKKDNVRNLITNHHKDTFITISLAGRLGNIMFQLAALLICAKQLNITAIVPANTLISSYFLFPRTSNINVTPFKTFYEETFAKYDSNIENLDTSINWTLSGYYQSWKYFCKDEHLIRKSFEFRPIIYEPAEQLLESFRVENKTIVGVHVRRGDMTIHELKILGYTTAPLSYLHKSMNYFRERYINTYFIVVSDDISWCKENIIGNNDISFTYFDNAGTDIALLSVCDHVIMTSGTFGWWGALLAGGDVVYFKNYLRPGSDLEKGMCLEDYYLPQWIGME